MTKPSIIKKNIIDYINIKFYLSNDIKQGISTTTLILVIY